MAITVTIADEDGNVRQETVDANTVLTLAPGEVIVFDGLPEGYDFTPVDGAIQVTAPGNIVFTVAGLDGARIAQPGDSTETFVLGADTDTTNTTAESILRQLNLVTTTNDDSIDDAADGLQDISTAAGGDQQPDNSSGNTSNTGTNAADDSGTTDSFGGSSDPTAQFNGVDTSNDDTTGPSTNDGTTPPPIVADDDAPPPVVTDDDPAPVVTDDDPPPVIVVTTIIPATPPPPPPQQIVEETIDNMLFHFDILRGDDFMVPLSTVLRVNAGDVGGPSWCAGNANFLIAPHNSDVLQMGPGDTFEITSSTANLTYQVLVETTPNPTVGTAGVSGAGGLGTVFTSALTSETRLVEDGAVFGSERLFSNLWYANWAAGEETALSLRSPFFEPQTTLGNNTIAQFPDPRDPETVDQSITVEFIIDGEVITRTIDVTTHRPAIEIQQLPVGNDDGPPVTVTSPIEVWATEGITGGNQSDTIFVSEHRAFVNAGDGNDTVTTFRPLFAPDIGQASLGGRSSIVEKPSPFDLNGLGTPVDGGNGDDHLYARDMTGGSGADVFSLFAPLWQSRSAVEPATIRDFDASEGDLLGIQPTYDPDYIEAYDGSPVSYGAYYQAVQQGDDAILQIATFGQVSDPAPAPDWQTIAILENVDASTITDDVLTISGNNGLA